VNGPICMGNVRWRMNNLILARKKGEAVMIGDDIEVTVVEIRGGKVRLGFKADSSVKVYRNEVYDKIKENQEDGTE
jgi:carbon storage regulator